MASANGPKTAVVSPVLEFLHLPFSLRHAGDTFQKMMDQILGDLPNLSSHVQHLQDVLELCQAHGLMIVLGKYDFGVPETEFLGLCLTSTGLQPLCKLLPPSGYG